MKRIYFSKVGTICKVQNDFDGASDGYRVDPSIFQNRFGGAGVHSGYFIEEVLLFK